MPESIKHPFNLMGPTKKIIHRTTKLLLPIVSLGTTLCNLLWYLCKYVYVCVFVCVGHIPDFNWSNSDIEKDKCNSIFPKSLNMAKMYIYIECCLKNSYKWSSNIGFNNFLVRKGIKHGCLSKSWSWSRTISPISELNSTIYLTPKWTKWDAGTLESSCQGISDTSLRQSTFFVKTSQSMRSFGPTVMWQGVPFRGTFPSGLLIWQPVTETPYWNENTELAEASIDAYWGCKDLITHAPLFRRGEDHVCESPLGDSCFVMNIHNPFMHCVTSQYVFELRDVIMLMRAVTIVAA